jgi:hypothetical protein
MFSFIHTFCANPAAIYPVSNMEQVEIFINAFTGPAQPMLFHLGSQNIDDSYIQNIV